MERKVLRSQSQKGLRCLSYIPLNSILQVVIRHYYKIPTSFGTGSAKGYVKRPVQSASGKLKSRGFKQEKT